MDLFKRNRYRYLNKDAQYMGRVLVDLNYWYNHPDPEIAQLVINLTTSPHELSENWAKVHCITTTTERSKLQKAVFDALHYLKLSHVKRLLRENSQVILHLNSAGGDIMPYMEKQQRLEIVKVEICKALNIDILK